MNNNHIVRTLGQALRVTPAVSPFHLNGLTFDEIADMYDDGQTMFAWAVLFPDPLSLLFFVQVGIVFMVNRRERRFVFARSLDSEPIIIIPDRQRERAISLFRIDGRLDCTDQVRQLGVDAARLDLRTTQENIPAVNTIWLPGVPATDVWVPDAAMQTPEQIAARQPAAGSDEALLGRRLRLGQPLRVAPVAVMRDSLRSLTGLQLAMLFGQGVIMFVWAYNLPGISLIESVCVGIIVDIIGNEVLFQRSIGSDPVRLSASEIGSHYMLFHVLGTLHHSPEELREIQHTARTVVPVRNRPNTPRRIWLHDIPVTDVWTFGLHQIWQHGDHDAADGPDDFGADEAGGAGSADGGGAGEAGEAAGGVGRAWTSDHVRNSVTNMIANYQQTFLMPADTTFAGPVFNIPTITTVEEGDEEFSVDTTLDNLFYALSATIGQSVGFFNLRPGSEIVDADGAGASAGPLDVDGAAADEQ